MAGINVEVNTWNEKSKADQTSIQFEKLADFIHSLEYSFKFFNHDLRDPFSKTIYELANGCDERGLSSTVYGDLDSKTSVLGVFHCAREENGKLSIFYTVHFLSFELERENVDFELQRRPGVCVDISALEQKFVIMARSAMRTVHRMGVNLAPDTPLAEGRNSSHP